VRASSPARSRRHDPGFGKFSTVQRAARTGRNPATGAELEIKAATAPKFTAAAGLKAAVKTNGAA